MLNCPFAWQAQLLLVYYCTTINTTNFGFLKLGNFGFTIAHLSGCSFLLKYRIEYVTIGLIFAKLISLTRMVYWGDPGFAIGFPCGVCFYGLTTCHLYVCQFCENIVETAVVLQVWHCGKKHFYWVFILFIYMIIDILIPYNMKYPIFHLPYFHENYKNAHLTLRASRPWWKCWN